MSSHLMAAGGWTDDSTLTLSQYDEEGKEKEEENVEIMLVNRGEQDEETLNQIALLEEQLLQLFCIQDDETLDVNAIREKARMISERTKKPAMLPISKLPHSFPCKDTYDELPSDPSHWPQRPIMLRPSPYTSTKIHGIRRASTVIGYEHFNGFCSGCILPVNTGKECDGESLVIDFESTYFIGTMLLRIKQVPKLNSNGLKNGKERYQSESYFDGKKRKFQAVVKGRFKKSLSMCHCVTGQSFNRPAGKLPAKWIVSSFIRFISTLAPQLEATVDGDMPRFLSPLVATTQTVLVSSPMPSRNSTSSTKSSSSKTTATTTATTTKDIFRSGLEDELEEPPATSEHSIMNDIPERLGLSSIATRYCSESSSVASRMKGRKRAFNAIAAAKDEEAKFRTDREYTFEFYQHLLDFGPEELALDMGRPVGKAGLSAVTNGQPIKFMSAYKDPKTGSLDTLWSFDIWHESLYPYAKDALSG